MSARRQEREEGDDDARPLHGSLLLLVSDDLRPEPGCYGSRIARTPNVDPLAARGVRFDRA